MIADSLTIVWKEFKELLSQRPGLRGGWIGLLFFIVVFGIIMPLQLGDAFIQSPATLAYWGWVPFILVSTIVADAFAGERERHTLETLLASRLSDRAILFGKILASMAYGWGLTIGCVLLGLITVNVAHGAGALLLFPGWLAFSILSISFLITGFATGLGILISLRAPTVRQAQQTLSIAVFIPLIPLFLIPLLPENIKFALAQAMSTWDVRSLLYLLIAFLALVDAALLAACLARFQRAKLILE